MKSEKIFKPQDIVGILPPLLTPFDENEEIRDDILRQEIK